MSTELAKTEKDTQNLPQLSDGSLSNIMELATELSKSDLIPKEYQNKPANCLIAIELANRLKASPIAVMQSNDVIYGRPSLRSSFIIGCINASGKIIGSLKFEMDVNETKCRAWAIEKETGARLTGPTITLEMAKAEGWLTKNGSKWKTMPGLMLRYRAASFFGRLYCPEIMNGMYSSDEIQDVYSPQDFNTQVIDPFAEETKTEDIKTIETKQTENVEITAEMEKIANEYFEHQELLQPEG